MKRLTSLLLTAVMIVNLIPNSLITAYANTTPPQQMEQALTEGEEAPVPAVETVEQPVSVPTEEPEVIPTEEPEVIPTEEPEVIPTEEPEVIPTEEPEAEPSVEPSSEPMLMMAAAPFAVTNRKYDHIDVKIPAQYHVTVDGVAYVFTGSFDADTIVVTIKGVPGSTSDKVYRYSDYIGTWNYSTRTEYDGSGNTMN